MNYCNLYSFNVAICFYMGTRNPLTNHHYGFCFVTFFVILPLNCNTICKSTLFDSRLKVVFLNTPSSMGIPLHVFTPILERLNNWWFILDSYKYKQLIRISLSGSECSLNQPINQSIDRSINPSIHKSHFQNFPLLI